MYEELRFQLKKINCDVDNAYANAMEWTETLHISADIFVHQGEKLQKIS